MAGLGAADLDNAIRSGKQALRVTRQIADHSTEAHALVTLAIVGHQLDDWPLAKTNHLLEQALALALQICDRHTEVRAKIAMAHLAQRGRRFDKAACMCVDAARVAFDAGQPRLRAQALTQAARAHLALGSLHRASACLNLALGVNRDTGSPLAEARTLALIALVDPGAKAG